MSHFYANGSFILVHYHTAAALIAPITYILLECRSWVNFHFHLLWPSKFCFGTNVKLSSHKQFWSESRPVTGAV